jgi:dihydropteroate synthase
MHMRGKPKDMQEHPWYQDVVQEVGDFLQDRLIQAIAAGVRPENIILDPGIGFGKRLEDNLALIRNIGKFSELSGSPDGGYPVLLGHSRKGFIRLLQETTTHNEDDLGPDSQSRLFGSIAAGLFGVAQGARILRVHDPRQTRQSLQVWWGIQQGRQVE